MNELIIKFYISIISKEELEVVIRGLNLEDKNNFEIDIMINDQYDEEKAKEFPDGFLYFPFFIEYYKGNNKITDIDIENAGKIITTLWQKKIPIIASCDFEDKLPENGGYKSKNIPW